MSEPERDPLARRLRLIEALLSLALALWCLWSMIPEHRRQLLKMAMVARAERVTGAAARRAGAASMGAELVTGQQNYSLAYALSLARDDLSRIYERVR